MPLDDSSLSDQQLRDRVKGAYARAKPINDQMVDIALEVRELTARVYYRAILRRLPAVGVIECSVVAQIECNVNPAAGLPQLLARITAFEDAGSPIERVEYDTGMGVFRLYAKPTEQHG